MEARSYPTSISELSVWRKENQATAEASRRRFVQFVVLASIASDEELVSSIALKGGNALRFVHGNMRSTLDLDFSAEEGFPDEPEAIRSFLDRAMRGADRQFQVRARCQSVNRKPKRPEARLPTYAVKIGYQLVGDRHYAGFWEGKNVHDVVDLEISLNDVLCETIRRQLSQATKPVRVCSLEDILAEKLRALLQQPIRNRNRPQDVYDVCSRVRAFGASIDLEKVSAFLLRKSQAREIMPRKSSYDAEVQALARQNYEVEIQTQPTEFIPFDEAWAEVMALVAKLSIPE